MIARRVLVAPLVLALTGCAAGSQQTQPGPSSAPAASSSEAGRSPAAAQGAVRNGQPFATREVATLDSPWAMEFLPDGRALITQKAGRLVVLDPASGSTMPIDGVPDVVDDGQGGLADIVLGPDFGTNHTVYLSWVEKADGKSTRGVVGRATLDLERGRLEGLRTIWRQDPAATRAHYSLRLVVSPDKQNLFVTSGERQQMTPAQDLTTNQGKILRLELDGTAPSDNPFVDQREAGGQIWSYGHRNALGIDVDKAGNLWSTEMGPKGGDELNLIEPGANYGWPVASEGQHYDGRAIPHHTDTTDVIAPAAFWVPSISPANLEIYTGSAFPQWTGDAFIGGLSGEVLTRVDLKGRTATKAEEWPMGARIREVEQAPDGSLWLLTDGPSGRVLQLTPP